MPVLSVRMLSESFFQLIFPNPISFYDYWRGAYNAHVRVGFHFFSGYLKVIDFFFNLDFILSFIVVRFDLETDYGLREVLIVVFHI